MSSSPPLPSDVQPTIPVAAPAPVEGGAARRDRAARWTLGALIALAGGSLLLSVLLWQRLGGIQEQLARQSADSGANAIEARALARQAQELARDAASRQVVLESKVGEVALQRAQLEDLIQTLSRSRDENLVVDIEAALHLAQQQTQLTGSAEPLLAALRTAEQRLGRAAQPRYARLRAAIARDIGRIRTTATTDVPGILARLDDVVRLVDELPVANAPPARTAPAATRPQAPPPSPVWWQRWRDIVLEEARALVRVSRIDEPDAVLLAPEQAFFLRENLKLKLLNARLSLLARQNAGARADVGAAIAALQKYFDTGSRRTNAALAQLQQVQAQVRSAELPRIDETLAALATAASGR